MLGNTSSPFGQKPNTPGFGTGLSQPTFGSPGTSAFGAPQQQTFGQSSATAFGQPNPVVNPTFGQTSAPVFGQPSTTSVFGQGTATAFGTPATQPTFGTTPSQPTFGATPSQPTFGAQPAQPTFGTPTNQPTFGTPAAQPTFGAPATTPAFGAPTATPAFGAATPTPAFGAAPVTTTPAFGAVPAANAPAFGVAPSAATPSFGTTTPAFGSATTPAFGAQPTGAPTFGTTTTTPAFGNPASSLALATSTQQKPAFGVATTQPSFNFGGTVTAATTTVATQPSGFQFGSNLGQTGFGAATTTTATPALGTATTQSLAFPAPQTTASLSFGAKPTANTFSTPATTTQSSLTFGSSLTPKPSTTQGSTGFSFGTLGSTPAVAATTTQTTNPTIGLSNFTTTGPSLGSVIGGKSMLTITGNTATPLYSNKTADLQAGRSTQIPPKCQNVHPSVMELVELFKNNMKEQKHLCLEVSRASLKPISKISNDAENIKRSVMKLERAVNKNKLLNSKLKEETIKALADVEIAQKAMDIPGGFPSDNSIITDYFLQLANKFQQQVLALRVELESTEKSILCELNPVAFTPQELSTTMQRLYECFVALAGRFQFVHAQISNLKVQHLELRRKSLEDYTDIFSKKNVVPSLKPPIQVSQPSGPSPFSGTRSINSVMSSLGYPMNDASSFSSPNNNTLNISGFGSLNQSLQNNNLLTSSPQQSTPGSKRGKR